MQPLEGSLLTLAHAVADGDGVDWEHAEASAQSPDERDAIAQLRRLATVGVAARAMASHWGPLEIRSEVGSGTFGTVYRAWDKRLEREVALKLLNGEHGERQLASTVVKEGRLLAQIHHPNVVTVFGADAHDGRVGLWMEFVTGRTLKDILIGQGPFSPHEAAVIGRDLCRALAAVHQRGFVHRDIKAQNVMREAGGRTVLMDFGAGGAAGAEPGADGALAGTPAYLAPEVLAGGPPSVKSDLYSLGVLLYYMVSGEFPVTASSLAELRARHLEHRRRLLRDVRPDLPSAFVRVVDRATAADPAERPESAGAMERLIDAALRAQGPNDSSTVATASGAARAPVAVGGRFVRFRRAAYAAVLVAAAAGAWLEWRVASRSTALPVTRNSVAILPFRNLSSPGSENDYFSEGVTDDVATHLARLGALRVISGRSVARFKDRRKTPQEIGAELGVAAVLDGSVRREGNRIRIVSQLLDARTGEELWSESYDREAKDIFVLQSEVSRKIALALRGELSNADAVLLKPDRAQDFEAFNLYLKGRYNWSMRTEEGLTRGVQYFHEAIARSPGYAPAYAGLADAYTLLGVYGILPRAETEERAFAAATKAIELDESLAEAHASLGYIQKNQFHWSTAEASFKRAIALKPGYGAAHHWYASYLAQLGRFPEAIVEIKTALSLDPLSTSVNAEFGAVLILARRYDEAIAQIQRTLQMDPSFSRAHLMMAEAHAYVGAYDQALDELARALQDGTLGAEDQELVAVKGYVLAMAGRRAEALAIVGRLAERYRQHREAVAGGIVTIYAALGDKARALDWLATAVESHDSEISYLKVDRRLDGLRSDPRFERILAQLGLSS